MLKLSPTVKELRHVKKFIAACACALSVAGYTAAAHAQQEENGHISLGVGYWDILDDEGAADFRLEYRPNKDLLIDNLKPYLGAEVTSDGSVWGGFGFYYDAMLTENIYLAPTLSVGLYAQGGSDLDLGHTIEFRSQLEVGYEFDSNDRLGLAFGHLSNASIDDQNPGTEVLNVYWHIPY